MKVLSSAAIALIAGASSTTAFAPSASQVVNRVNADSRSCLAMGLPFFAEESEEDATPEAPAAAAPAAVAEPTTAEPIGDLDALSMEEEVELLVQKELAKTKRMSNLRNEKGVEYAPWMGISEDEENKIRSLMRDRTEARRKRQEQERDVSGNLFRDSQAQELSGTGLSAKIIDGEVELTWATKTESDTKGFIVKRRAAKTNDYSVISSYKEFGPLASKGKEGGVYRYLDSTATPGGWVYRISEEDNYGNEADVCQCLVEVETADEQKAALIAGVGFGVFAIAVFVAGVAMDPMNGY
ncbi:hypothetical protein ACHAXR_008022 [Thalassiosira sp. AJA248-18]